MKILALDLGKFNTMCCFFDTKTRKHQFLSVSTDRAYLTMVLQQQSVDLVVMEACGPSGWISDLAQSLGLTTLVCSTNEEAWRWTNVKRKTDKDDALKLARMAAMKELKSVHLPTPEHREFRALVKYRKVLDGRINRIKNTIRAWFVNHGIPIASGERAWHTGRAQIDSYRKPIADCGPSELWQGALDIELSLFDMLTAQLDLVVKQLDALGKQDPRIVRLQTMPGVGPRTAEILVACIDDPHRFQNGRQVSAYFGLVPRQYQSGETDRHGRITKRGNPIARTILVECAWAAVRYNPWAKAVYERICGGQKTRKKKAGVALARKIAVIAWALLRDEKNWDPQVMIRTTKSFGGQLPLDEQQLQAMPPKECRHKRKRRLAREAKAAALAQAAPSKSLHQPAIKERAIASSRPASNKKTRTIASKIPTKAASTRKGTAPTTTANVKTKPRRARQLESRD